ncbi:hypothetical protein ASPWEDRAFT_174745 [Aspergillus wentii DTO 134E9]|uniref:Zn(2)-C6 fungal-type domain-containing protein n=1 Tax=Aspergillus wentii DTO 134E9 TaxID=1073089 RepID=A0A1L9REJ9_ASPWE|nr:uncharacterized protein ASPWEDRAFT_174745 [Aspergillus wentii DTO 134E9]OJJ33335.1 hypothetical protein ASPWEDRAFT_174745 [Aspergillus wentii DTO 134E9]
MGRIGLAKSRNGCTTCKTRKVKCDEKKPQCVRCTSTGRKCEYEASPRSRHAITSAPASLSLTQPSSGITQVTSQERRAFEYYFYRGAQAIGGGLDVKFWKDIVLQVSRSEPSVWDAIISISSFFENKTLLPGSTTEVNGYQNALSWYSRSMVSVRKMIGQNRANKHVALITCALYICIETMQGHMPEALRLYEQGVRLISELRAVPVDSKPSLLEDILVPLFFRMGTGALAAAGVPVLQDPFSLALPKDHTKFLAADTARTAISSLGMEFLLFRWEAESHLISVGSAANVSPDIILRQCTLLSKLEEWNCTFARLKKNSTMHQGIVFTLQVFQIVLFIMLSTALEQLETCYTVYLSQFRLVVEYASQALEAVVGPGRFEDPFTFELGMGQPLLFTAMKCRDPYVRREALSLLRRLPRVQGFFQCGPGAARTEQMIRMEENPVFGLMVRRSDVATLENLSQSVGRHIEPEVKEITMDRLANLPTVEELVEIEDVADISFNPTECEESISEEKRIRKLVPVQLVCHSNDKLLLSSVSGSTPNTRPQTRPFFHFTRNMRDPIEGVWKETEFFLPI